MKADIVVDLQYGDCAKGKVSHYLLSKRKYTHSIRYNGGGNAGHTIYHKGKKFVTHQVPAGLFFGVKSIIGPGCVVNPKAFLQEIAQLKKGGIKVKNKIYVAENAHVVTSANLNEDRRESRIGTTKSGIGPTYRDKYARVGQRAEDLAVFKPYLIDLYQEFFSGNKEVTVLAEGAQGFGLDIDWGDYPYVTSSACTVAGALQNGIPYNAVREVWGVAKVYETYVGKKKFEPNQKIFARIRGFGEEYGATTGRPRQCNWINIQLLEKAIRLNSVTHIVLSKVDVLRKASVWKIIENNSKVIDLRTETAFKKYLSNKFTALGIKKSNIFFSEHKDRI
jgi:adenylosuccinate synthase